MAVLASFFTKTDYESAPIVVPGDGGIQLFASGDIFPGVVEVLVQGSDTQYHSYSNLSVKHSAAIHIGLLAGTTIKIRFTGCKSANAEIVQ